MSNENVKVRNLLLFFKVELVFIHSESLVLTFHLLPSLLSVFKVYYSGCMRSTIVLTLNSF